LALTGSRHGVSPVAVCIGRYPNARRELWAKKNPANKGRVLL